MTRCIPLLVLLGVPTTTTAADHLDQLPQPDYQRQPSDPPWLASVVQFHGHLGPAVVAGARMGMIGLRAVEAKGYFDVEVTCEGPMAKPPQACFLDGVQVATGATMGKRTLHWVHADQILVRVKNTRSGRTAELRPTPALMELLAAFQPQAKAGAGHGPESKAGDEHLAAVARKIAAMLGRDVASVTMSVN
jgi:formylmethanofuran dehydrogenase subunit E